MGWHNGAVIQERRRTRRVLLVLMVAYSVVIGLVTLTPAHVDQHHDGWIGALLGFFSAHRLTGWLTFATVEKLANVAMFVPFGFLLAMLMRRSRWWIGWLTGALFSCFIEGTQGTLLAATRVADVSDLITNTLGAGIGAVLAVLLRRRTDSSDDPVPRDQRAGAKSTTSGGEQGAR